MKNSLLGFRLAWALALVLALVAFAPTSRATPRPDAQRILEGKLSPTLRVVHIDHRFGPVSVVGVDEDFGWRWQLNCSGDRSDAAAYVKDSELEVLETGGTLEIRFAPPERRGEYRSGSFSLFGLIRWGWSGNRDGINLNSTLELRVPRTVTVSSRTVSAPSRRPASAVR